MTLSGLLDTSVFIAQESGRSIDSLRLPHHSYISVVTIAELQAGVLAAKDTDTRSRRMATLDGLAPLMPLAIDSTAAAHWARLRVRLHEEGRRINVNDLWIAAVALANDLPVVTQDDDFAVLNDLGLLEVIAV
ncbi:type II toxin-antitoxin system VapC family toxin [Nocardioides speluncae]|uniref:type II toxin-antitoxin system VapC family toxin n=1 Tax=Nocardioides speluncae TaxID=2670337 RepID=UPI00198119D1|nr:type II toxin-antitoxin system VapC family toxin [Nocardioides speluncae]